MHSRHIALPNPPHTTSLHHAIPSRCTAYSASAPSGLPNDNFQARNRHSRRFGQLSARPMDAYPYPLKMPQMPPANGRTPVFPCRRSCGRFHLNTEHVYHTMSYIPASLSLHELSHPCPPNNHTNVFPHSVDDQVRPLLPCHSLTDIASSSQSSRSVSHGVAFPTKQPTDHNDHQNALPTDSWYIPS